MKCKILHESKGRIRVHIMRSRMTLAEADILDAYLSSIPDVCNVKVYDRTGDAIIRYTGERETIITALAAFSYEKHGAMVEANTARALQREYEEKLVMMVSRRMLSKLFLPAPVRFTIAAIRSVGYIQKGLACLLKGKIEVPVLDAVAVSVSLLRGDYKTASSVMFLLRVGELLEEWTHKKSVDDLARTMSLDVDKAWTLVDGQEVLMPVHEIACGQTVIVRMGTMVPLDGKVIAGEAMLNQASMTGESMPVCKRAGAYVYAGTVVEEGECRFVVEKTAGSGRYDRIVRMIEESEKLKSSAEAKAFHLADRLVSWTLGATVLTGLLTRNPTKALAILMVDFSCALKLAMPLTVLSAMREANQYGISVKGGRFLEAVSDATTIVFDKTGTLTHARPILAEVVTFDGRDKDEMLRLAACLEEHYPHSMAKAVVDAAVERRLNHEEHHSKVEYIVAHGISSEIDGEKVIIGSHHFVFGDEGCVVDKADQEKIDALGGAYSHLYMAISGRLVAVLCIEDPLRPEARDVVQKLRQLGMDNIVMMTGDSDKTARAVASEVGVDRYYSEVLPEDKAAFVRSEKAKGRKVIMIGDGVNDSPALSEADVGIAISDGAAIAREIADITIAADDLYALVALKKLSNALMKRIDNNYRFIMSFNGALIALGVMGVLQPTTSALLHNLSTLGISLHSMTNLMHEEVIDI